MLIVIFLNDFHEGCQMERIIMISQSVANVFVSTIYQLNIFNKHRTCKITELSPETGQPILHQYLPFITHQLISFKSYISFLYQVTVLCLWMESAVCMNQDTMDLITQYVTLHTCIQNISCSYFVLLPSTCFDALWHHNKLNHRSHTHIMLFDDIACPFISFLLFSH